MTATELLTLSRRKFLKTPHDARVVAILAATPALLILLVLRPIPPDMAAQLARADVSGLNPTASWWTSWYGGITTPSYSLITPILMHWIGCQNVGVVSAAVTIACCLRLLPERNLRLSAALVSFGATANVLSGRITFALGAAFGALTLVAIQKNRRKVAIALTVLTTVTSPLAGMFLVVIGIAAHGRKATLHRVAPLTVPVLVSGGVVALAFPLSGIMPISHREVLAGASLPLLAFAACTNSTIKRAAVLLGIGTIVCALTPNPIGGNILRLPVLFAAPAIVATSQRKKAIAVIVSFAALAELLTVTSEDIALGHSPSASESFYAPLVANIPEREQPSHRIEVLSPDSQGAAYYVSQHMPLARGWERQVDVKRNPLFYDKHALTPESYRTWLDSLAVAWVAVPSVGVDYGYSSEANLLRNSQLPYLTPIWRNNDWILYAVDNPSSMTSGPAQVSNITAHTIRLNAAQAGSGLLKVSWASSLKLEEVDSPTVHGAIKEEDGVIRYSLPTSGTYDLHG